MTDHLSQAGRSRNMSAIRSSDTKPELTLRAALRSVGAVGYRIHVRGLPGKPDIAFTRWRLAIFVDGVFWHGHPAHFAPERASTYWREKIARTQTRDRDANHALCNAGWTVLRFWDLEVGKELDMVVDAILAALREAGWQQPDTGLAIGSGRRQLD
ncbi:MAG: very short patch repair endonuclease [Sporichthyaceae bacterium]|nr:very short patch repair endonuclease [Sporichthyaceae bacterium]